MKLFFILPITLLFCIFMNNSEATTPIKKKKFENPALQFEGTWRVDSYDFREFKNTPENLHQQLKEIADAFPIGQRLSFAHTGSEVLPGTIDPMSMKSSAPIGETLEMTILQPFISDLCKSYWEFLCKRNKGSYKDGLMISNIAKWGSGLSERRKIWPEIKAVEYTFLHLGKSYNFDVWMAKSGDMLLPVVVEGHAKDGGDAAIMGILLKRIQDDENIGTKSK